MKDARGHGSNERGTPGSVKRFWGDLSAKFKTGPNGEGGLQRFRDDVSRHIGGGTESTFAREAAERAAFAKRSSEFHANLDGPNAGMGPPPAHWDAAAANELASGSKSTPAPVHGSMDRTMVAGDDSDGTDAWSRTPGGDRR